MVKAFELAPEGIITEIYPMQGNSEALGLDVLLSLIHIYETAAIVVGPPIMMKFAVAELLKLGMKEEQIWISPEYTL